jgi:SAF domain-containing protein
VVIGRHRRRSVVLGAISLALGIAALSGFGGSPQSAPQQLAQVVVLRRAVTAGRLIVTADLAWMRVPAPAPAGQVVDPAAAIGRRSAVDLPSGAALMDAELQRHTGPADGREVAVRLDDAAGLPDGSLAGGVADVYLTTPAPHAGVHLLLADVAVVATSRRDGISVATLRVAAHMVAVLIDGEAAGSLRLVARTGAPA